MNKYILIILAVLLFADIAFADRKASPPEGWRYPNEKEIIGNWKTLHKSDQSPFHISSDFNQDGIVDEAWILIKANSHKYGLFAFIGSPQGKYTILKLDEGEGNPQSMGVAIVEPRKYRTACGKKYWKCTPGELEEIEIKKYAINYFMFESANSFFYWSNEARSFNRIWISD